MNGYRSGPMLLLACALSLQSGCALQYYDEDTGTDHIWGFGHMAMKVSEPEQDRLAVVKGTEIFGLGLGLGKEDYYAIAGWNRRRLLTVIHPNTAVRFDWQDTNFFNVRVGSEPPKKVEPTPPPQMPKGSDRP